MSPRHRVAPLLLLALSWIGLDASGADTPGSLPVDAAGRPLNLDFEAGDLRDWTARGDAFAGGPVEGDTVSARRPDQPPGQQGQFWVGTYEGKSDAATGTLTSRPFRVTQPFASFLIGGGFHPETRAEIVRRDSGKVVFRASGEQMSSTEASEVMKRVAADLTEHVGREVFVRVVDQHTGHWGHVNFDDFRLHATRPAVPPRREPPPADVIAHSGLSPEDAAKAMTVPPGFKVTLFAGEPDVIQPIALAIDDRGRLWVAEAYSYPHKVKPEDAKDRILIFEDADNDGKFDTRKVFADKLNLVSGLEVGYGGVWVGMAPQFLFIPDADGDDRPDGPPRVLLDGWGQDDTHEMLNSFAWGPDGWLYGCHGVFTHSRVGKPGTPDAERIPINAGTWRYHPKKDTFEVFAHGTSNPWGIDWDENGQMFITSCVIPHLYHMIPGGRYERQAGPHFNPYTYDDLKTIADHRHYIGGNPHAANGVSDSAGGGHAHAGALIYKGNSWPEEYRGSIFMNNIHGARLNRDTLAPKGSGFVGSHAPDFLKANDSWSQIVSLKAGPDGCVYMIDWYDKNQCHRTEDGAHDRTNGRIFKVSYGKPSPPREDLSRWSDRQIANYVSKEGTPEDWRLKHALRILAERGLKADRGSKGPGLENLPRRDLILWAFSEAVRVPRVAGGSLGGNPGAPAQVDKVPSFSPETMVKLRQEGKLHASVVVKLPAERRLHSLWGLHAAGAFGEEEVAKGLATDLPVLRAWTIRFAVEDRNPSPATLAKFADFAGTDPSPVVRLELAAALQRLPLEKRWDILERLYQHAEDAGDHNLPLMLWYAAEPLAEADTARALRLALASPIPPLPAFMVRRVGAIGTPGALAMLVEEGVEKAPTTAARLLALRGINEALKGRRQVAMPASWPATFAACLRDADAEIRSQATALAVTFGDPKALEALRVALADAKADRSRRAEALEALVKARDAGLPSLLRGLLDDRDLRGAAIRGLAGFDDAETPAALVRPYASLDPAERRDALNTLAARPAFARALLRAVAAGEIPRADLSADVVRQVRNLGDSSLATQVADAFGSVRETPAERVKEIAAMKALLATKPATPPDPGLGRAVFAKTCAQCHTLFGVGGKVGPELTGSNRADLGYVLENVFDPSALIGKDYLANIVATADGRVLTGILRAEDKDSITLVTANEELVLPKADVEDRRPSDQSMMPEGLWKALSEHEIRSLVAYLASPAQVPSPPETSK